MTKENCITWEIAKTKSEVLKEKCPLQEICKGEGCMMSVQKIEKPNKRKTDEDLMIGLAGSLK
jgi:hypothetical protein